MADIDNSKDDDFQRSEVVEQGEIDKQVEVDMQERVEAEIVRINGEKNAEGIREKARLPDKYVGFTIRYKCFWIWINLFNIVTSIAMATGGVLILGMESDQSTLSYQQC